MASLVFALQTVFGGGDTAFLVHDGFVHYREALGRWLDPHLKIMPQDLKNPGFLYCL
jgi:hypothetical protein